MNGPSSEALLTDPDDPVQTSPELETARLEILLSQRARDLIEQRTEAGRVQRVLRDALDHFEASGQRLAAGSADGLRRERDLAVTRALEAEAGRTELRFRLDEALGHLAGGAASAKSDGGGTAAEALDVTCARLTGTVRGLVSALAETQEGRDMSEARLLLAEQDLSELRTGRRSAEIELAEVRDQLQLQQLTTRRVLEQFAGGLTAGETSARKGELDGARARRDEAELAVAASARLLDAAQASLTESLGALAEVRAELLASRAERAALASKNAELQQALTRETENRHELGLELNQAHAQRVVVADELGRVTADLAAARAALAARSDSQSTETGTLSAELAAARTSAIEERERSWRRADALRSTREQLGELSAAVVALGTQTQGNRDASHTPTLIESDEGLEVQLAASEERARRLARSLSTASEAVRELIAGAPDNTVDVSQLAALRLLLAPGQ